MGGRRSTSIVPLDPPITPRERFEKASDLSPYRRSPCTTPHPEMLQRSTARETARTSRHLRALWQCLYGPKRGSTIPTILVSTRERTRLTSGMSALYTERYLNDGRTSDELVPEDRPVIGIAQTGSDLAPCNQHHLQLAKRVKEGIIAAGGTPLEFPCHPIQESSKRPTASLDRNLAYLSLVEVLYGYPLDGVVLLTGCDKTWVDPVAELSAGLQRC